MTNSLSMKMSGLLALMLILFAGCHSSTPANNPAAGNQAQSNGANSTSMAADANGAAMGVPGTQPAQQPATGAPNSNGAVGPGTAQSTGQTAGPELVARPAAGSTPVIQSVSVPAGTVLRIRLNERLTVKHTQTGQTFTGSVVEAVAVNGATAIDRGAEVRGIVDRSHRRGHFKGASILELRLTSLDQNGQHYRIDTHDVVQTKKGKGKRSFGMIGGGAGLGMLIGGVATGGVGLLVGGLAGGGAGTLGAAFTGNRDVTIPAESVLSFRLADSMEIHP